MSGSAESARWARGGLQAPRITYGRKSTSSFFLNVARMSISVRIPKPSLLNSSRARSTTTSYGRATWILRPYGVFCSMLCIMLNL